MADAGVVYLNADFVGFWGSDLDVFDREVFTSLPGHSGLVAMSDIRDGGTGVYLACDSLMKALSAWLHFEDCLQLTFPSVSDGILSSF